MKGRDIWTVLNGGAVRVGSDTKAGLDCGWPVLGFGIASSPVLSDCSSFVDDVVVLTGVMCAGTGGGEGDLVMPDSVSDSAALESGGEK